MGLQKWDFFFSFFFSVDYKMKSPKFCAEFVLCLKVGMYTFSQKPLNVYRRSLQEWLRNAGCMHDLCGCTYKILNVWREHFFLLQYDSRAVPLLASSESFTINRHTFWASVRCAVTFTALPLLAVSHSTALVTDGELLQTLQHRRLQPVDILFSSLFYFWFTFFF